MTHKLIYPTIDFFKITFASNNNWCQDTTQLNNQKVKYFVWKNKAYIPQGLKLWGKKLEAKMLKVVDMEKRKGDMVKFLILKWLDVTPHENLPTMAHRVHVAVHWWWVDRQPIAIPIKLVTGGLSLTCFRFVSTILLSFWSFLKIKNKNISIVNWKFLHNNIILIMK